MFSHRPLHTNPVILSGAFVILSEAFVILSEAFVILSEAKDLCSPLAVPLPPRGPLQRVLVSPEFPDPTLKGKTLQPNP